MNSKRSLILGGLAVLVIAGAVLFIARRLRRPPVTTRTWFYDLNTDQLFPAPLSAVPPIPAPSGPQPDGSPAGVRAYVFGCSDCGPDQRFIAYLETYTAEARARLDRAHQTNPTEAVLPQYDDTGVLVRRPAEGDWVERDGSDGRALMAAAMAGRCPAGVFPQLCRP